MNRLSHQVIERIQGAKSGIVFSNRDFLDLGSRAAVDQALSRLTRQGEIRRVHLGLYDIPRHSPLFGILSPSVDEVIRAVSRRDGTRLLVSGARAANILGLSTQVPAKLMYHTDGHSKRIRIGQQVIEFRHASQRRMAGAGRISGLVIQALRWLGKDHVDEHVISRLKLILPNTDRQALKQDVLIAPHWLRSVIDQVAAAP